MVRMDIIAGLKNAVERGHSLEKAKQTLANAGYSKQEIQEAASYLTGGMIQVQHPQNQTTIKSEQQTQNVQSQQPIKKKKFPLALVFLLLILFILVSFLILSLIFKEELVILFQDLFG